MDELIPIEERYEKESLALYMATFKTIELLAKAHLKSKNYIAFINKVRKEINALTIKQTKLADNLLTKAYIMSNPGATSFQVETALKQTWNPLHYSERIWKNTNQLCEMLESNFVATIESGGSMKNLSRQLQQQFSVAAHNANALLRTESTAYYNTGAITRYRDMGITKYRIVAEVDNRTSKICKEMDGKVFQVSEAKIGVNLPVFHVFCRSTIAPIIAD